MLGAMHSAEKTKNKMHFLSTNLSLVSIREKDLCTANWEPLIVLPFVVWLEWCLC